MGKTTRRIGMLVDRAGRQILKVHVIEGVASLLIPGEEHGAIQVAVSDPLTVADRVAIEGRPMTLPGDRWVWGDGVWPNGPVPTENHDLTRSELSAWRWTGTP